MNERRLTSLLACSIALLLGSSCGEEEGGRLGAQESPVGTGPRDGSAQLDAGSELTINKVTASGSGCTSGTWSTTPLPDGSGYELTFKEYAITMTGTPAQISTKACNVSVDVSVPKDVSYAVRSFEYAGSSQLGAGMSAEFSTSFAFTGVGVSPGDKEYNMKLPASGPFKFTAEPSQLTWSPCDFKANLQLRTRAVLQSSGPASGQVQIATLSKLQFVTRSCKGEPETGDGGVDAGVAPDASQPMPPLPNMDGGMQTQPPTPPAPVLPVVRVTTAGSHCGGDTAKSVIAPDGRSFTVNFDGLTASNERTNAYCRVAIEVMAPKGKSYALEGFSAQGTAELPDGVSARLLSVTDFTGAGVDLTKEKTTTIAGPRSGPFSIAETFSAAQLNFSRCDASPGNLGLRFRVVLDAPPNRASRFSVAQLGSFKFVQRDCP